MSRRLGRSEESLQALGSGVLAPIAAPPGAQVSEQVATASAAQRPTRLIASPHPVAPQAFLQACVMQCRCRVTGSPVSPVESVLKPYAPWGVVQWQDIRFWS